MIDYKKVIIIFTLSIISFFLLIKSNENLKDRYFDQVLRHTLNIHQSEGYVEKYKNKDMPEVLFMPQHVGMFTAAIDIFEKTTSCCNWP